MFQSIHVSVGYSAIKMNSAGPLDLSKKNTGEVSALLKMGNVFRAPFGGFIEAENVVGLRKVKLIDIKYLCTDADAETIEYVIQRDHYVVGTYQDRKLYILLFDGQPKHHQIKTIEKSVKNNVFL
ncbi:hypothetical protein JC606_16350 [Vibrio sp. IB15]|uniref:hypothetical protein n=1 Tax=Vibrio sp. IB15 TaxID=2779368 RepID=UPI0018E73887|nr:hypothetical protein [Vibrio sp. IB15]MBJ2147933.1 hypothetical protein [Vibrio sp. IB15]